MPKATTMGRFVAVSGPSGVGKTTLCKRLLGDYGDRLQWSVSATTRPKRPGEEEGVDYHFLSPEEFDRKVKAGEFHEWEEVFGRKYGTLKSACRDALDAGKNLLAEVDVKGGMSIKGHYGADAVLIFIDPPDQDALFERLRGRGSEQPAEVVTRLERATSELALAEKYDYRVVNDDLGRAYKSIVSILHRERILA